MAELKRKIINILFWVFLIISVILILWRIFGNNPSEISIIVSVTFMMMFKMWDISNELKDFKYDVKLAFTKVRRDFDDLKLNRRKR